MRLALALFLALSLIACGGGGDDDATSATVPATPQPSPTTTTTSTTASSPTSQRSPQANATIQPGGGIQQQSTAEAADPTPTRRPVTVVTTPRPVAKTATPSLIFPTATATVAEVDDGITVIIDDLFDDPASTTFFTGETDYGAVATIENGRYSIAVPETSWQSIVAVDVGNLGNAAILVEAGMDGDGAVGVVGRSVTNEDGSWNFYVCWLATDGRAGCHVSISSEWTQLFIVEAGAIAIQDVNQLLLTINGTLVAFSVNDISVGSINDEVSALGTWGIYAESFSGTSTGWFERVMIATIDE